MHPTCVPSAARRSHLRPVALAASAISTVLLLTVALGCNRTPGSAPAPPAAPAAGQSPRAITTVKPERRTIRRTNVGQPGYIQAFERTEVVSKIPGYVKKWNVDIGDPVKKGDVLAELWVPELVAQHEQKVEQVQQAEKVLAMARAQIVTAKALIREAEAGLARAEANRKYWRSQSERFSRLARDTTVIDKQSEEETANQYRAASAAVSESEAKIKSSRANQAEKEAARDKAQVDVRAAEADERRVAALVGYTRLLAPYRGVVTWRNKNLSIGQFVQPATGGKGDVLYVVEQKDPVRVFVAVPEADAEWVGPGAPARVGAQALVGREFAGKVTRTAWSLNNMTRTLLTEIDLPNPDGLLRPGLYAYATLTGERRDLLTLPASSVETTGDVNTGYKAFCYLVESGKVRRTPIEAGARNDQLVEVLKKQVKPASHGAESRWEPFTGEEEVVKDDLKGLKDGQAVTIARGR